MYLYLTLESTFGVTVHVKPIFARGFQERNMMRKKTVDNDFSGVEDLKAKGNPDTQMQEVIGPMI